MLELAGDENRLDAGQSIGPQIHALLRARIVRGDLEPGARLSESGIAARFGVSRQPVREVFIKLADEGLLEIRPQRGSVVPRISREKVENVRFVREAVEADVVRLAAILFTNEQKDVLDGMLTEQENATDQNEFMALDDAFHRFLAEGIGRSHAWSVVEAQKVQLDRVRYLSLQRFPTAALIEQHGAIIRAIQAGNAKEAEKIMREHLRMVLDDLPKIAERNAEFFVP
ncbi:GntR family transcriptional regulator [Amaricoccus tamworthensis]|uniref:GntR family transcriptional regulator n=1 Tax=Amaricoccus tamworthensis TaxID=57002 RepID=UPI003C7973E0